MIIVFTISFYKVIKNHRALGTYINNDCTNVMKSIRWHRIQNRAGEIGRKCRLK